MVAQDDMQLIILAELPEYLLQLRMGFAELFKACLLLIHLRDKHTQLQLVWVQSFLNAYSCADLGFLLLEGCSCGLHLSL